MFPAQQAEIQKKQQAQQQQQPAQQAQAAPQQPAQQASTNAFRPQPPAQQPTAQPTAQQRPPQQQPQQMPRPQAPPASQPQPISQARPYYGEQANWSPTPSSGGAMLGAAKSQQDAIPTPQPVEQAKPWGESAFSFLQKPQDSGGGGGGSDQAGMAMGQKPPDQAQGPLDMQSRKRYYGEDPEAVQMQ